MQRTGAHKPDATSLKPLALMAKAVESPLGHYLNIQREFGIAPSFYREIGPCVSIGASRRKRDERESKSRSDDSMLTG